MYKIWCLRVYLIIKKCEEWAIILWMYVFVVFQMFLTDITINQVVVELKLKKEAGKICFDYEGYANVYGLEKPHTYVNRYTTDFTFKVSRNLLIYLYIFQNIDHWCSKSQFKQLLHNIAAEISDFTTAVPRFHYKISNIN